MHALNQLPENFIKPFETKKKSLTKNVDLKLILDFLGSNKGFLVICALMKGRFEMVQIMMLSLSCIVSNEFYGM